MSLIRAKIERLKADISRWGVLKALQRKVYRWCRRALGVHLHVIRTCALDPDPELPARLDNMSIRKIQKAELIRYCDDPDLRLGRRFVNSAIARGDQAFGIFDGSRLVAYTWRAMAAAPHGKQVRVRVPAPYNYSYKAYTHPDFRGRRLMPTVLLFSDKEMLEHGFSHRAGFVDIDNFESLAAGKYMGSNPIGYAGYVEWFGRFFAFRTRAVREIGFEFYRCADSL